LPGGMLTSSPVRGFLPMPVFRGFTLKTPKRRSSMRCPRPSESLSALNTVSTACSTFVRVTCVCVTTAFTMSTLIKKSSAEQMETYARQQLVGCPGRPVQLATGAPQAVWSCRRLLLQRAEADLAHKTLRPFGHNGCYRVGDVVRLQHRRRILARVR